MVMRLLDWLRPQDGAMVVGRRVTLRAPTILDHGEWSALRETSRDFLQPWEPTWPHDDLTRAAFRHRVDAYDRERSEGTGLALLIHEQGQGRLVGQIRLSNIRRGVAQTGSIGYWMGQPYARAGYMLDALQALSKFAFGPMMLSRLEAQCVPHNDASAGLLLKAGFQEEGLARAYLKINGVWRDHRLFGLVSRERSSDGAGTMNAAGACR